jgi:hypothetical protein
MRRHRFCQVEAKRLCSLHMRTALYVLLALAAVPAYAGQTVWKWVDEKGVTHFSDQPVPGAEKLEYGDSKRDTSPTAPAAPPAQQPQEPEQKGPAYSRFVIESPRQDEAIINTGGQVQVRLATEPALSNEHTVSLYLDGQPAAGFPSGASSLDLAEMPRGTHTVKAVVTNSRGTVLQETPPVTFHVRQESRAQPPVGPAMRNPNRPRTSGNKMPSNQLPNNKMPTSQPSYAALNGGKASLDPRTNMPIETKPAKSNGPKAGK